MNAGIRTALAACAAVALSGAAAPALAQTAAKALPLLPIPSAVTAQDGSFPVTAITLGATDPAARAAAARVAELMERSGLDRPPMGMTGSVTLAIDPSVEGEEAYRLVMTPAGATITAGTETGLFYGAQTLWQMAASASGGHIAAVEITDGPAFEWRGVMLDSARHFQPADYVRGLIDRMAMLKLNRLHWHLSDDQGWRLPVPEYPRLTSHGAWRQQAGADGFDPETGEPRLYGGFYSEEEIRQIVAYAAERHVTIVPEIDLPGHMTAAIAAYPALSSSPNPPARPSPDWGVLPNLINPGPYGMAFSKAVLDQLMRLFPGEVIHIGGDEAVKDQWNANPAIQRQIRELGLKDATELQAWFTAQLSDYLAQHGRRAIGWDEILDGPVTESAMVMSWRGVEGAVTAAQRGHDAVLAAAPVFYMDHRQSLSDREPPGRGAVVGWQRLYEAETLPAALDEDERAHIRGVQINLWTEHVRTTDYADRMLFPRAAALAEMGWSAGPREWDDFVPRLLAEIERERALGYASNLTPLEPIAEFAKGGDGRVIATLSQPANIGTIRYTLDGSAPVAASPAYDGVLELGAGTVLTAQAFNGPAPLASAQSWTVSPLLAFTRSGNTMDMCSDKLVLRMEDDAPTDGQRGIHATDILNPCWIWREAPLDGMTAIAADVIARPYNFELHDAINTVTIEQAANAGTLHIRLDDCEGPQIAALSLAPVSGKPGVNRIEGTLDRAVTGDHDICMTFAQEGFDPLWMLDRLTLEP